MSESSLEKRCLECELSGAALSGDSRDVQLLLVEGADAASLSECNTALCDAVTEGFFKIVATLLEAGADANQRDFITKDSALYIAIDQGNADIAQLLVEKGANPGSVSLQRIARQSDAAETIRLAVAVGVDPNREESETLRRALHEAAIYGYVDNTRALIDAGARKEPLDKWGNTPLELAGKNHHSDVEAILREHSR